MVIGKIHNLYSELTAAEKRIASYVLSHPREVAHMTVGELSGHCETAPSAVMRFCKSIGIDGFSEFKIMLAQELGRHSGNEMLPAFDDNDDNQTVFKKVFSSSIHTLQDTLSIIDFEEIQKVCEKLAKANRILLFGVGTSSVIALDAAYRFSQIGLQAQAYTDILFMNVAAANIQEGDVVIGISHSGRTKAVVNAMRQAKDNGAVTIGLTSYSSSILSRESEFSILAYPDEENYPVEAVSARVAHLCVIDALMMCVATMKYENFAEHISARNKALEEIRYE